MSNDRGATEVVPPLTAVQARAAARYRADYAKRAGDLALAGWSDARIAERFGVHLRTFRTWCELYPELAGELEDGRSGAVGRVARSLERAAEGFEHPAIKLFIVRTKDADGNVSAEVVEHPYLEYYPPNVEAAKFFLTNRDPEDWKNRQSTELGGSLEVTGTGMAGLLEAMKVARAAPVEKVEPTPGD